MESNKIIKYLSYFGIMFIFFIIGFFANNADKIIYYNFDNPVIVQSVEEKGLYCKYNIGKQSKFIDTNFKLIPTKFFYAPCNTFSQGDTVLLKTKDAKPKNIEPVKQKFDRRGR